MFKPSSQHIYLISCRKILFCWEKGWNEETWLLKMLGFVLGTNNCFSFATKHSRPQLQEVHFLGVMEDLREALLQPSCLDWPTFFSIFEFPHPSNPSNQLSCHSSVLQVKRDTDKGIVHPKNENSVVNYSPSYRSKPVRPSFIYRTQIKIFLMNSESSLTLP